MILLFAWVVLQSLHSAVEAATCRGDAQSPHRLQMLTGAWQG